ncbi:MAG: response regulator transcription factor, partial [Phaeodactylibacter sp.]|nr:response regulator transcription factor [Phaeodactylibacter sp.]
MNNPAEGPAGGANAGPDIATTGQLLIVEDNTDMRALFTDLLSDDFNLKMVNNGQEAWDLLQTDAEFVSRLDLILSDVMMPEMDGYTLLGKLKETPRLARIPVIMITARADEKDKLQALRMGVDDYLTKPFSPGELVARARNLILHLEQRRNILADERSKLPNPDF